MDYRARSGGHCAGGPFGGCCRTFASTTAGDAHRQGDYATGRECIDVTTEEGWRLNQYGEWTNSKPMDDAAIERKR
jgi:hypothetical protein